MKDGWPSGWFREEAPAEWAPLFHTICANMFEVISPPAALGSGRRGLAHKCALLVYSWSLGAPTTAKLRETARSYVSHTSDMGVELSMPDFHCPDPTVLLPEWMVPR